MTSSACRDAAGFGSLVENNHEPERDSDVNDTSADTFPLHPPPFCSDQTYVLERGTRRSVGLETVSASAGGLRG